MTYEAESKRLHDIANTIEKGGPVVDVMTTASVLIQICRGLALVMEDLHQSAEALKRIRIDERERRERAPSPYDAGALRRVKRR